MRISLNVLSPLIRGLRSTNLVLVRGCVPWIALLRMINQAAGEIFSKSSSIFDPPQFLNVMSEIQTQENGLDRPILFNMAVVQIFPKIFPPDTCPLVRAYPIAVFPEVVPIYILRYIVLLQVVTSSVASAVCCLCLFFSLCIFF